MNFSTVITTSMWNISNVFTDTLTWDREQHIVALITDVYKNIKLKTEYFMNEEKTGASRLANNEFLTHLEIKF